jgi:hypothetical protein
MLALMAIMAKRLQLAEPELVVVPAVIDDVVGDVGWSNTAFR